ncbi:AAA domain-containing protein [Selenomonas sp. GACV-9]|uniref:AAA domain-containing protein n=1 Tax=Selenomonas sp. GACV-9 TaxID=3158782 RepID=UPI00387DD25C
MQLYEIYDRCRQEPEQLELMVGAAMFFSGLDSSINHPMVMKRVRLHYDKRGAMQLVDTDYPTDLYLDMFQDMPGVDAEGIRAFTAELDEAEIHPLMAGLPEFLQQAVPALTPNCRYVENRFDILPTDWYLVYPRQVLFLRRRNEGIERAIAGMMAYIDTHGEVPTALMQIVDPNYQRAKSEPLSVSLEDIRGEAEDILLTKQANAEQLAIARKIEAAPAVVVQGPPGTGKTHTIANLLGHFLSQGQHVLVTSATSKALTVLKEKLPAGIQDLCVTLLEDSRKDMERSVSGICDRLSRSSAEEMQAEAEKLAAERHKLLTELAAHRTRLENIQRMEARRDYFMLDGKAWSLSRMAAFLHDHEELAGRIPGAIQAGASLPLSAVELAELYASNAYFDAGRLAELGERLPDRSQLLTPAEAGAALEAALAHQQERSELLAALPDVTVLEDGHILRKGQPVASELSLEVLAETNSLYEGVDFKRLQQEWAREAVLAGQQGGAHREVWEMLGRDIRKVQQLKQQSMTRFFGREFAYTLDMPLGQELIQLLSELAEAFDADGHLSLWNRLRHSEWKKVQQGFRIDGKPLSSRGDCQLAMQYVALHQAREVVRREWTQLLVPFGMISYEELAKNEDDIDDLTSARWQEIEELLDWYPHVWNDLMLHWRRAGVNVEAVYGESGYLTPHQRLERELSWLEQDFPRWQRLLLLCYGEEPMADKLAKTRAAVAAADGVIARQFEQALAAGDAELYHAAYEQLAADDALMERYHLRQQLIDRLAAAAPVWADAIREQQPGFDGTEVPEDIGEAWLYAQFEQQLLLVPQEDEQQLGQEIQELTARLHQTTMELAEKRSWYHLLKDVAGSNLQSSLIGWSKAVAKIGRGKGRYASRHIREARQCMLEAQAAVPAWIMPLSRVWQNLRPESQKFDIILIDEASQADITALPLLYFGKKVIIVGDDRQVSPSAVGVSAEDIQRLQTSSISGIIKHDSLYTMDTSLYDIAQMNFEARMLTEHFRCVPEIIGYCNQLAYDGRIRPLRETGTSLLMPMVDWHAAGQRDGTHKRNLREAEEITATLAACLEQPEYAGKTFGAISLLGDEQAKVIRELAVQRLGIGVLEERQFLCGNPARFQGDERDVVFLSFVDSPAEEGMLRLLSEGHNGVTGKRYNVAVSRARDQLWLFHSMAINDLKDGDIRRGLLEYAAHPESCQASIGESEESSLETAVARALGQAGYHVEKNFAVGAYAIDMVVIYQGHKVAIDCDGEHWVSSLQQAAEERCQQAVLERLGWKFLHVRGSRWYREPEQAFARLTAELALAGIEPEADAAAEQSLQYQRDALLARVRQRAGEILSEWHTTEEK